MLRLLKAGLIAAGLQVGAVAVATIIATHLAGSFELMSVESTSSTAENASQIPFLAWVYLLTAFGVALTSASFVDINANRIRHASFLIDKDSPLNATRGLLAQLGVTVVLLLIEALNSPPSFLVDAGQSLGNVGAARLIWTGIMSVGIASFGATARATWKAV